MIHAVFITQCSVPCEPVSCAVRSLLESVFRCGSFEVITAYKYDKILSED
jgi:hypothetical protein